MRKTETYPFTVEFTRAVVGLLVADPAYAPRLAAYLDAERIEDKTLSTLASCACAYIKRTGHGPLPVELTQETRLLVDAGKATWEEFEACRVALDDLRDLSQPDPEDVLHTLAQEARRVAVRGALDEAIKHYGRGDVDAAVNEVVRADAVGKVLDVDLGSDYALTLAKRTKMRKNPADQVYRHPTGIPDLDRVIAGGLAAGELGVVLGATGSGKTMALAQFAAAEIVLGGVVAYYTLEVSDATINDRIDANLAGMAIDSLRMQPDEAHKRISGRLGDGTMICKKFPAVLTTASDIRAHLREARSSLSLEPTLVIVDYGDILGPSPSANSARHDNRYEELGGVYAELSALAAEWNVPVWTASQARREALTKRVVSMVDIAESFKKCHVADLVIALCRTPEEQADDKIRFYIAKARYTTAGIEVGPLDTDYRRGRLVDADILPVAQTSRK